MAMPTRSARTTEFGTKAPTPVTIGPGSYLGTQFAAKGRPSLAAFASSECRSYQGAPSTPSGPGPGSYVGIDLAAANEGDWHRFSYCFESRAPRLAPQYTGSTPFAPSSIVEVPGPGTYETATSITRRTAPVRHTRPETQGVEFRQSIVPSTARRFNPPSVPRREQSFGYNVDSTGRLLALPAPFPVRTGSRADCAGPGDYNPEDRGGRLGHGGATFCKGRRRTVFEQEWVVTDMRPGPGDYNPKMRPRFQLEMPGSSPFLSGVPKGEQMRFQGIPGPGQYAHESPLGASTSVSNVPLLSGSAQRGAWLRSEKCPFNEPDNGCVPGPGAYGSQHDYSCFNKPIPKTLTDEQIGFSSTEKRTSPGTSSSARDVPGPGQYDLDGQSIVGALRHKNRVGCKGVFGSSGDRFRSRSCNQESRSRTPMHLWDQGKALKRVVVLRQVPKSTSSFKSETDRFKAPLAAGTATAGGVLDRTTTTPPATQYVIKDSFDQIVEKGIKSKAKSFLSTTERFDGGFFDVKDVGNQPGPGTYNVDAVKAAVPPPRSRAQSRSRLPQCSRFVDGIAPKSTVGPGSHEIAGSLIKKTYNITFGGACIPAGAGRVAHRLAPSRKLGGDEIQLVGGSPANVVARKPKTVIDSSEGEHRTGSPQRAAAVSAAA